MMSRNNKRVLVAALAVCASPVASAAQDSERQQLTELRNTVVNLLEALVERGVVTREQAQAMVSDAQTRASADAAEQAKVEAAEAGAVRVPYVPEVVREEIRKEVADELAPEIRRQVVRQAQLEGWGVPGALPEWVSGLRLYGDVRVRSQGEFYASDNVTALDPNPYLDYLAINDAGGTTRAGKDAFINTTEDRDRLRLRARAGIDAQLAGGWSAGLRFATGDAGDPVSTNQTFSTSAGRYPIALDQGYIRWSGVDEAQRHGLTAVGGRIANPFVTTDLIFDNDLTFDGIAGTYRLALGAGENFRRYVYLTAGAFPLEEVELSGDDKWLYAGQAGIHYGFAGGSRLRLAAAYYDYRNITGERNAFDSTLLDYTAPRFLQKGNTLFNIRNSSDISAELFALANEYQLANVTASAELKVGKSYRVALSGDYVRNIGYDADLLFANAGYAGPKQDEAYLVELAVGADVMARRGAWRATVGYRYIESDSILDAFADSDFHLGGTDAEGYVVSAEYAATDKVLVRLRYLSANEILDPLRPFGVDVLQLDLNARF